MPWELKVLLVYGGCMVLLLTWCLIESFLDRRCERLEQAQRLHPAGLARLQAAMTEADLELERLHRLFLADQDAARQVPR